MNYTRPKHYKCAGQDFFTGEKVAVVWKPNDFRPIRAIFIGELIDVSERHILVNVIRGRCGMGINKFEFKRTNLQGKRNADLHMSKLTVELIRESKIIEWKEKCRELMFSLLEDLPNDISLLSDMYKRLLECTPEKQFVNNYNRRCEIWKNKTKEQTQRRSY